MRHLAQSDWFLLFLLVALGQMGCGSANPDAKEAVVWAADERAAIQEQIRRASFDEAEHASKRLLAEAEAAHGPDSLETGQVLNLLVETLWRSRRAGEPETLQLAERAMRIHDARLDPMDPGNVKSLLNLGVVLEGSGDPTGAKANYERALEISETQFGPSAAEVGDALVFLANMFLNTSRYEEARPHYERLLEIRESSLGPDHPKVGQTLNNLALLLQLSGDYEESESFYRRALSVKEKASGPDTLDVAWTVNGLASVLADLGDYSAAMSAYERALAIREQILGSEHFYVAHTLNNMAYLLLQMADYVRAEQLYARAGNIMEEQVGAEHPETAVIRNNLAELLHLTGDYREARRVHEEVLQVRIEAFGPEDQSVAGSLRSLAAVHAELGEYAEAERTYNRALEVFENSVGSGHRDYAGTLRRLAELYLETGRADQARTTLARTLAIQVGTLGSDHAFVAKSLHDLAGVVMEAGDLDEARELAERAVQIRESSLGPDHPLVGLSLNRLGLILARSGETTAALKHSLRAEQIGSDHLRLTIRHLPERRALRYATVRSSGLDLSLSLAAAGLEPDSTWRVWDALCRSRALVLDEMARRHSVTAEDHEPELARRLEDLSKASRRVANLTLRGPGEEHPERYLDLLKASRKEKEAAERALAESSVRIQQARPDVESGLGNIAKTLPSKTALVAFAIHDNGIVQTTARKGPTATYTAFVLADREQRPVAIALGSVAAIDGMIASWRLEAAEGVFQAGRSSLDAERSYRELGDALRREVWDPLSSMVKDAERVLVVPAGMLHLVNLAALPIGQSGYVIENGPRIHLLSAERDVVANARRRSQARDLLVLGGPSYDDESALNDSASYRGSPSACGDFRTIRFASLPGTIREARIIKSLWEKAAGESRMGESQVLTEEHASETAFKQEAPGKRVLHLATHGFFLGGRCASMLESSRGIGGLSSIAETTPAPIGGESPLLLSGLALAGANRREQAAPESEDGVLTAEEIAAMDLRGVEWAVLSACDTGVGKVHKGEGVLGLQRAFKIAGAGTVIMSLWPVSDLDTYEWMTSLYERRLVDSLATDEAVHEASITSLERRRRDDESTHPFHWAAFVAVGDWI